jgi:hypothetical protein
MTQPISFGKGTRLDFSHATLEMGSSPSSTAGPDETDKPWLELTHLTSHRTKWRAEESLLRVLMKVPHEPRVHCFLARYRTNEDGPIEGNRKMKLIITFLALVAACQAQQFWLGSRSGMTKAALAKLFGSQLKLEQSRPAPADTLNPSYSMKRRFCGNDFEVSFYFEGKPAGLALAP